MIILFIIILTHLMYWEHINQMYPHTPQHADSSNQLIKYWCVWWLFIKLPLSSINFWSRLPDSLVKSVGIAKYKLIIFAFRFHNQIVRNLQPLNNSHHVFYNNSRVFSFLVNKSGFFTGIVIGKFKSISRNLYLFTWLS